VEFHFIILIILSVGIDSIKEQKQEQQKNIIHRMTYNTEYVLNLANNLRSKSITFVVTS